MVVPIGEDAQTRRRLSHSAFLKGAEPELVTTVLEKGTHRQLAQGEVLLEAGQLNTSLFILLSGRLGIYLGPQMEAVALLGPGDVVGELSLIDGQATSAQVVADSDSAVWVLAESDLWPLLRNSPQVFRNLLQILTRRMRHLINQQLRREYAHYTVVDAQTGLYSRHWLDSMLAREMRRSQRDGSPLSLLLIGIEQESGDQHDSAQAEALLETVASVLKGGTRPGEMIARYGRDEFMILLTDATLGNAREVGTRLRERIHQGQMQPDQALPAFTVRAGAVQMDAEDTPSALIDAVDEALVRARGTDEVEVFALDRRQPD